MLATVYKARQKWAELKHSNMMHMAKSWISNPSQSTNYIV